MGDDSESAPALEFIEKGGHCGSGVIAVGKVRDFTRLAIKVDRSASSKLRNRY